MVRIYPKRPHSCLNKGIRYLVDQFTLNYIKSILPTSGIVQVGPGKGHISKILPKTSILVEVDTSNQTDLDSYTVIWKNVLDLNSNQISNCSTLVSNLPYDRAISILIHCVKNYTQIRDYYVIVQEEVALAATYKKGALYHKMNHLFEIEPLMVIPCTSFYPVPKVNGYLLHLKPKLINWGFIEFLNQLKYPRKTLHNNGLYGCKKRVQEVSTEELLTLYNYHIMYR